MALQVTAPEPRLGKRLLTLAEVCDAVVELLHGVSLSLPFIAERRYLPVLHLEDMDVLKVTVCPGASYVYQRITRAHWTRTPSVSVLFQKRIDDTSSLSVDEQLDVLMATVEEARDALAQNPLPRPETWGDVQRPLLQAMSIESDPVIVPEHIETLRQFTSGLVVSYLVVD